MKKNIFSYSLLALLIAFMGIGNLHAQQSWDFTQLSSADQTNLDADDNWDYDSSRTRWSFTGAITKSALTANGVELNICQGLLFTCKASSSGSFRFGKGSSACLWQSGSNSIVIIPNLKKGQTVTVTYKTSSSSSARTYNVTNLRDTEGFVASTDEQTGKGIVEADGDVVLTPTGGLYVYRITVSEMPTSIKGETTEVFTDEISNNVALDLYANQMQVSLSNNDMLYYNTNEVSSVDVDKEKSQVTVTMKNNSTPDVFYGSVRNISFSKGLDDGPDGVITNNGIEITNAKGWYETAFVEWNLLEDAKSYNVYVKGGNYSEYTKIDVQLVRNYGSYGRADVVGLVPGTYAIKVVAVDNDGNEMSANGEAAELTVVNYQRDGFAFFNRTEGVGAYNNDGSLKSGARVIYITKNTAKTVTCDVITNSKGGTTTCTGFQTILDNYMKGYDSTPITFRIIGTINKSDLDHISSSAQGLQVKNNRSGEMNITIEGIGNDATFKGFGLLLHGARSIELRNFAIMLCMEDCISIEVENKNVWVHHLDFFYGQPGSDSDQAKGDGTVDVKDDSQYITISFNHFWDAGKSSLCGMKSESGPNYISYDHNWFDHSDSRHPRVRTMSVHVWNNYFDGNSKYGVGATMGSSVFVEKNYFRNCKFPMMSSLQGNDVYAGTSNYNPNTYGTFSKEAGGSIKSFDNVITGSTSSYWPYGATSLLTKGTMKSAESLGIDTQVHFDAYEATSRNETVPNTVKSFSGNYVYDNFDTNSSLMYSYTPDNVADVPAKVVGWYGAGRLEHGDFKWTFSNSDDTNSEVIQALKTAINSYATTLVGIFGDESASSGEQGGGDPGGDDPQPQGDVIECHFQNKAPSNDFFTVSGNYGAKGTVTIDGVAYTNGLKMEKNTSVTFTTTEATTMMLAFPTSDNQNIKIDGAKVNTAQEVGDHWEITYSLGTGSHTLQKNETATLYFIRLTKTGE